MPPKNTEKKKKQEQLAEEVKRIRKDPSNLVCADCPVRSTPYVCIDYSCFVCTECAGIHRLFNHRVKSIAVATFNEKEVANIREGGNANQNRKYLAKYKKNKDAFTMPREGQTDKIKQYIQMKYIDKKWYKENPKPPKPEKSKKKKIAPSVLERQRVAVQKQIRDACNEFLNEPDWEKNMTIVDHLNREPYLSPFAIAEIRLRLKTKNPEIEILALQLTETIIKNCPSSHAAVAQEDFMRYLVKIGTDQGKGGTFTQIGAKLGAVAVLSMYKETP